MGTPINVWLVSALADAERRGLGDLKPLLENMAKSTTALRAADAAVDARERRETDEGGASSSLPS